MFWGLIVWSGGAALLAQIAREPGKRKEVQLFASWGGKPTTRLLRHRDATNKVILERRHKKLAELIPDLEIPSAETELVDPQKADEIYEACTVFLIEKTRDAKQFPLIFEENCNYGFRRNLCSMRPIGIALSLLGAAAVFSLMGLDFAGGVMPSPIVFIAVLVEMFLVVGWLFYFTSEWVKTTAEAYAERLLAASENLEPPR